MKNNTVRFRTILPKNTEAHALRYVEYDMLAHTGSAFYCDPDTGARIENDPLNIGSEFEYHMRLAQWIEQGDTIMPGWE